MGNRIEVKHHYRDALIDETIDALTNQNELVRLGHVYDLQQHRITLDVTEHTQTLDPQIVEPKWQASLLKNPRLFSNGADKVTVLAVTPNCDSLQLTTGLTTFKDFFVSVDSTNQIPPIPTLTITGIPVTADRQVVLLQRNQSVAKGSGWYSGIAGFVEADSLSQPSPMTYETWRELNEELGGLVTLYGHDTVIQPLTLSQNEESLQVCHGSLIRLPQNADELTATGFYTPESDSMVCLTVDEVEEWCKTNKYQGKHLPVLEFARNILHQWRDSEYE